MIKRVPIALPPADVAAFVADMRAFYAAPDSLARDEIAARQLRSLREHVRGKLRLTDVAELFALMHDHLTD